MTRFTSTTSLMSLVPFERSALPHVHVTDRENEHEQQHFDQQESGARSCPPAPPAPSRTPEIDRPPGDQEHGFDVEYNEEHRDEVEFHRKTIARVAERRHAALV